jgi:ribosome-associated protein
VIVLDSKQLLETCVKLAKEKKANALISLEIGEISLIGDYFLLMSAGNTRMAKAICDYLEEGSKSLGFAPLRIEGYQDARWILLDFGPLIVHIFQEEERQYYNLERLWGDAPAVNY